MKVLITTSSFGAEGIQVLEQSGFEVVAMNKVGSAWFPEAIWSKLPDSIKNKPLDTEGFGHFIAYACKKSS